MRPLSSPGRARRGAGRVRHHITYRSARRSARQGGVVWRVAAPRGQAVRASLRRRVGRTHELLLDGRHRRLHHLNGLRSRAPHIPRLVSGAAATATAERASGARALSWLERFIARTSPEFLRARVSIETRARASVSSSAGRRLARGTSAEGRVARVRRRPPAGPRRGCPHLTRDECVMCAGAGPRAHLNRRAAFRTRSCRFLRRRAPPRVAAALSPRAAPTYTGAWWGARTVCGARGAPRDLPQHRRRARPAPRVAAGLQGVQRRV